MKVFTPGSINEFKLSAVLADEAGFAGKNAVRITLPPEYFQNPEKDVLTDRPLYALLPVDFGNGVIDVDIASVLHPQAPSFARGFAGIAFRVGDGPEFEGLYLRPANGRADDQVRRNHSVQYFSYPDYDFARLRREFPEQYESYADIGLGEWIPVRIRVSGARAELYVKNMEQPVLIVKDLKLGAERRGGVALWVESGTVAYFGNLKITMED